MRKWLSAGLLVAVVAVAVVALGLLQKSSPGEAAAPVPKSPAIGTTVVEQVSVPVLGDLSPETRVAAERFRCICGCPDILSACLCTKNPGGITMKNTLQALVDRGLTGDDLDRTMVEKYGPEVLLFAPAHEPAASASP